METTIPFAGFYESLHDAEIDNALENLFSDDNGEVNQGLLGETWQALNMPEFCHNYAKEYVEKFSSEFNVKLQFKFVKSPREYNFTTDRIFCEIEPEEIKRLFNEADKTRLAEIAESKFKSRSGFISFYDYDFTTWGDVENWDHNQVSILIDALLPEDFDQYKEIDLMEHARGNGKFENWLLEDNEKMQRLVKIHDYLRQRKERVQ
jgi:hypothetical protein